MAETTLLFVFLAALVTALATGLGAIPLIWARDTGPRLRGAGSAIAAGLMIAASLQLVWEGAAHGIALTALGFVLGALFMVVSRRALPHHEGMKVGALIGADARKAILIVGVMTLHSSAEGIGVGVSFGGGMELGLLMTLAISLHNIPEGLAISLVLVPRGVSVLGAAWWSIFSSLPQPLLAVPAFAFVAIFAPLLPAGLGAAAGAMIWMALAEMLPDARTDVGDRTTALSLLAALLGFLAFAWLMVGH